MTQRVILRGKPSVRQQHPFSAAVPPAIISLDRLRLSSRSFHASLSLSRGTADERCGGCLVHDLWPSQLLLPRPPRMTLLARREPCLEPAVSELRPSSAGLSYHLVLHCAGGGC